MTLSKFISKYSGKTVGYPEGQYVGECLSLVKWYIKECFDINPPASGCNGARCYWSKFPDPLGTVFKKISNTSDFTPQRGDIMVWDGNAGGGYGHISICTGKNDGLKYFESLDQNWNGRHAHLVNHNYTNVYGVLRSNDIMEETSTEEPMEINNQTKIKLGSPWGIMEVQAIKSVMSDMKRDLDSLKKGAEDSNKLYEEVLKKYEELLKIHSSVKDDFTIELDKAREEAGNWKNDYDKFMAEVAGLLGQTQNKGVVIPEIKRLVKVEDKLQAIKDNRPVSGDNWIISFIKAMKAIFSKLEIAVTNQK